MDFDDYVAARYGRLIEHAVLLGCAEGEASTYVDKVLIEQRKRIRRADDPDPFVHEALATAIEGTPERRRLTGPLVALGLVAVAAVVGVALTYRPPPKPMPSLFGLDGPAAASLLEKQGYDVLLRPARACEPQGIVLGSDPRTGDPVEDGATVTVRTAVPSGVSCEAEYGDRSDAWEFVGFALGGAAPRFAETVYVVVDGGEPDVMSREAAEQQDRWAAALQLVEDAARRTASTTNGMPTLGVTTGTPPARTCGVDRPAEAGGRATLRLEIDPRAPNADTGCPLTVDLYRSGDDLIDAVVVYTGP